MFDLVSLIPCSCDSWLVVNFSFEFRSRSHTHTDDDDDQFWPSNEKLNYEVDVNPYVEVATKIISFKVEEFCG
jgi:hypothetical protein